MSKQFVPEPRGQATPETKLERFWRIPQTGVALRRQRVIAYDANALMTYAPMEYAIEPLALRTDLPTEQWIQQALIEFVRMEFSEHPGIEEPTVFAPKVKRRLGVPDSFLDHFLRQSEMNQPARPDRFMPPEGADAARSMLGQVFDLLCNPRFGAAVNARNNDRDSFIQELLPTIRNRSRLLLILPGFPFKDQNLFRVPHAADEPDCAETALLFRLHRLTQAVYQVHPYGLDVVVLSDGTLYGDIFGVSKEAVARYMQRLLHYRNRLNLQGTVSFLPLKDLIDRAAGEPSAWSFVELIAKVINLCLPHNEELSRAFAALVSGMKWNSQTRERFRHLDPAVSWRLICKDKAMTTGEHVDLWESFDTDARAAALKYASVNLMLRWLDLIRLYFPNAIRGTIHPKNGQFALAGSGTTFAWNGIAWSDSWPTAIDDIQTRPYFALADEGEVQEAFFEDTGLPAFYTPTHAASNISNARQVLPRGGWTLEDTLGREFVESDLEALVGLANEDPHFAWHREICDRGYLENLLRFRLSQYRQFGFGVHGLWQRGRLIGQCGLQVLDEARDEIEFAIFLGVDYTRQGTGLFLSQHVFQRCREQGLSTIYGLVRPGNPAGLALVRRLGGEEVGQMEHFGCDASKFCFELHSKDE